MADGSTRIDGHPSALKLPSDGRFPGERQDVGLAHPALATFVGSSGSRPADRYRHPVAPLVRTRGVTGRAWP